MLTKREGKLDKLKTRSRRRYRLSGATPERIASRRRNPFSCQAWQFFGILTVLGHLVCHQSK